MFGELLRRLSARGVSIDESGARMLKKILLVLAAATIDYSERVVEEVAAW